MSTQQPLSKLTSALIFISGAYLFFITLVLAPYINFTVFSSFHAATKLVFVTLAGIVSAIQLFVVLPYVKRGFMRTLGSITEYGIYVSLIGLFFSVVLSASVKTSLFGMYTGWESNVLVFLSYGLLLLAWYTYFLVLKQYGLEKIVFHTLLQLGLVVAIVYSIGEYYLWKPTTGYVSQTVSRISLGFRNPLFAAYFLGMLWSYSFAQLFEVLLHTQKKAAGIAKLIFGVILYIGITFSLILTFTRSALLSAGITAVVYVILRLLQSKQEKIGRAQILVAAALIALIAFTVGYSYRKEFSLRNTDLVTESQNTLSTISTSIGNNSTDAAMEFYQKAKQYSSSQIRLLEWKWGFSTWTGSLKNFLVGVGPDAGFFEMPKYRDAIFNNFPTDSSTKPFYVRSLYINTLMQIGIVSSLGIILVIFGLLQQFSKIGNKDWAVFALILAFFAQGIFYYPTHITIVLLIFALGYLFTLPRSEEEILYRKTNAVEKILLVLTAGWLLFWILPIMSSEFIINTYTALALPAPVEEMKKNSSISINNNVLKRYLVYHYPENETSQKILPILSKSNDVDDLRIAADAYYILARNTNTKAFAETSIFIYEKLLAIDSTLPATWDGLGLRNLYVGNFTEARDAFNKAVSLKSDYWYAYMHLGEVSRQQCNPKEALEWYKKAEQYIPTAETEISEAKQEIKVPRKECKQ